MRANDERTSDAQRYGAYVCLRATDEAKLELASAPLRIVAERLGFSNEFEAQDAHPTHAVAYLTQSSADEGQIADERLHRAGAIVHVASPNLAAVDGFLQELQQVVESSTIVRVLRGVVRPTVYTGNAMHDFAYAHQALQQPGWQLPRALLIPMNKTPEWWTKHWMERHTYFLPKFSNGQMRHQGHALAAAAGIPCIMRRTYKCERQPAPDGEYDFVNYFECADPDLSTFEGVLARLRDLDTNPEWAFVREGPTWRGRRVSAWNDLFR